MTYPEIGDRVRICGLQDGDEFSGMTGKVVDPSEIAPGVVLGHSVLVQADTPKPRFVAFDPCYLEVIGDV